MKTKYIIIVILAIIGAGFAYHSAIVNVKDEQILILKAEKLKMQENAKTEKKKIRDSARTAIDEEVKRSNKVFDSILNLPPTYKYIKYEKNIYPNRNLDDALSVHAKHKRDGN